MPFSAPVSTVFKLASPTAPFRRLLDVKGKGREGLGQGEKGVGIVGGREAAEKQIGLS